MGASGPADNPEAHVRTKAFNQLDRFIADCLKILLLSVLGQIAAVCVTGSVNIESDTSIMITTLLLVSRIPKKLICAPVPMPRQRALLELG